MVNYRISALACNILNSYKGIYLLKFLTTSGDPAGISNEGAGIMDYVLNSLGTQIILLLLLLDTIRSLIAAFGIVPPDTKFWGRVIYGKREKDIIKSVLIDMGYTEKEAVSSRIDVNSLLNRRITFGPEEASLRLLHVISCCINKYKGKLQFGDHGSWESHYYINTMGIVHQPEFLKDMADLLMNLIQKQSNVYDFFIVPKGGNPVLAQEISTAYGIPLIIAKDQTDTAKPKGIKIDELDDILFEGINIVLNNVDKDKRKLRGAVIDCNAAGGGQIISIVADINKCIDERQYHIEPITDCFVLFKLTKPNDNTDKKFDDNHCTLFRYFDLAEEDKESIYNSSVFDWRQRSGSLYDRDHMGKLNSALETMKEQGRVKIDNGSSKETGNKPSKKTDSMSDEKTDSKPSGNENNSSKKTGTVHTAEGDNNSNEAGGTSEKK